MKAKKIELKEIGNMKYKELLYVVLQAPGERGLSSDDVVKSVEVMKELDKEGGVVHLSEADYNWLLGRLNGTIRWSVVHVDLGQFIKDIREAPLVDIG